MSDSGAWHDAVQAGQEAVEKARREAKERSL